MQKVKIKINNEALQALYGGEIQVDANRHGMPKQRYWRNRLRDAAIDGCVEIVKQGASAPKKARGEN